MQSYSAIGINLYCSLDEARFYTLSGLVVRSQENPMKCPQSSVSRAWRDYVHQRRCYCSIKHPFHQNSKRNPKMYPTIDFTFPLFTYRPCPLFIGEAFYLFIAATMSISYITNISYFVHWPWLAADIGGDGLAFCFYILWPFYDFRLIKNSVYTHLRLEYPSAPAVTDLFGSKPNFTTRP